jgi:N-methylhydantoinase A/acetone carboxylase, beta subunit
LRQEFAALEKKAVQDFRHESWPGRAQHHRSVDLRYRGQGYELNIPFTRNLLQDFEQEHRRRYGYAHPNREVEVVTLRLRAALKSKTNHVVTMKNVGTGAFARPSRAKLGRLSPPEVQGLFENKNFTMKIYSREELNAGKTYPGPAIVTEYSATTVIPPACRFHSDKMGNLIIDTRHLH